MNTQKTACIFKQFHFNALRCKRQLNFTNRLIRCLKVVRLLGCGNKSRIRRLISNAESFAMRINDHRLADKAVLLRDELQKRGGRA